MQIILPALVLAVLGFGLGVLINFVAKVFYVEEDPAIEEMVDLLPRYNCGACGHPGCKEMAIALLENKNKPADCKPIKKDQIPVIQEYLDNYFKNKKAKEN
ncbi:MAG: electron transporter RnfB [Tenericutes bacterium HGW-Tenericutes-5]|jgi:Na+-translocating ferredoxin:NAD+ oxidoreductase RNF subunit RnfB|nr:MAG: electron transporter RnfB [Tenericutes bacterium HGW-Tenericutes-5]PKK95906.1 MAG: electron transporter RnfB [Tenericutes bacterium HGW-Tenericutes-4]